MLNNQYIHILESSADSFTCDLIASNLDFENGMFDIVSSDSSILDAAIRNNFSQIPLYDSKNTEKGPLEVVCIDLDGKRILSRDKIQLHDAIASNTLLRDIPKLLAKRAFYFVMDENLVRKIVTIADINNLPMKTYLLILLGHFDYMVTEYIRHKYIDEDLLPELPESVQKEIARDYKQRILMNIDTSKLDCIPFENKVDIISKDQMFLPSIEESNELFLKNCVHYIHEVYKRVSSDKPLLGTSEEMPSKEIGKRLKELSNIITIAHSVIVKIHSELNDGNDA